MAPRTRRGDPYPRKQRACDCGRLRAAMAPCGSSHMPRDIRHPTRVHVGASALRSSVTPPSAWRYTLYDCAARTASASAATDSGELPSALLLMVTYAGWPAPTVPAMTRASVARVSGSGSTSLSNGA